MAVYYSLAVDLRGREVIHFIDNSGAMACRIKDYSSDVDSARLVHAFWGLACALEIDVWFEFVYSEANVADWPSRGWLSFAAELGAVVLGSSGAGSASPIGRVGLRGVGSGPTCEAGASPLSSG